MTRTQPGRRLHSTALLIGFIAGACVATAAVADPRADYILNCRGCHGPDGAGAPGAAPSFRGQLGKFVWVPAGREYLIRVPGTAQSELSDARTAALLNWMLHEFSPQEVPGDFVAFTEEEVARFRRIPLTEVTTLRLELLHATDRLSPIAHSPGP